MYIYIYHHNTYSPFLKYRHQIRLSAQALCHGTVHLLCWSGSGPGQTMARDFKAYKASTVRVIVHVEDHSSAAQLISKNPPEQDNWVELNSVDD
eukprot:5298028-Amphidinium_carterae.2